MKKLIASLIFVLSLNLFAIDDNFRTGNLQTDFKINLQKENQSSAQLNNISNQKSPILAGALSALIPGAGEIYTGDYLKAILFVAVEGVSLYLNYHYTKKGDDQTIFFQNYADEYWSVVRYAEWLNQWASAFGGTANIHISPDVNLKPWQRVNWDELNTAERSIREFSHTLYPHGHQQYYEMIGKYPQYSQGWDDSKFARGQYTIAGEYYYDTQGKFIYYSGLRGKANDYYNYADKALIVTITNHIISMVDAIISANKYNSKIKLDMSLEKIQSNYFVEYYPQLNLRLNF
ncbi:MAG: hypothetical protein NUV92_02505 [Ignavibacteria bacterium]|jgi:hypothetical protein|nr:hypothetical protein [Ignavibacteria bacterium]MDH7527105.1 hypothetical protein [Ignavibacteria bacterium]